MKEGGARKKNEGMLMTFSPTSRKSPSPPVPAAARELNVVLSFTPGGTMQSNGMNLDETPEGLRRMREQIRVREERENPTVVEVEEERPLMEFLGAEMDAEAEEELAPVPAVAPVAPAMPPQTNPPPTPPHVHQELADALALLITAEQSNALLTSALQLSVEEKERLGGENYGLKEALKDVENEGVGLERYVWRRRSG